jgi:hypothetical protein
MEMDGPPITDSAGTKVEILIFVINPSASEKDKWNDIAAGTRVRFSTKLVAGLTDSITGFMPLAGKAAVMLFTEGGEFLNVAPK